MNHSTRLALVLVTVTFGATSMARAAIVNLVVNGEFDSPVLTASWSPVVVPGWTSTQPLIELWQQGFLGSPVNGADGLPTGQHMELNYSVGATTISQSVLIPLLLNTNQATFRFDTWRRGAPATGRYTATGSVSGLLATGALTLSTTQWTAHSFTFNVTPGETVTISFSTSGPPNSSAITPHIDQVAFNVDVQMPEPKTYALIASGLAALFWLKRRAHANLPQTS
jgi:hypothetical protein